MNYRPDALFVWVHGKEFRLRFKTKDERGVFINKIDRGVTSTQLVFEGNGYEYHVRPSSVDVYQVIP